VRSAPALVAQASSLLGSSRSLALESAIHMRSLRRLCPGSLRQQRHWPQRSRCLLRDSNRLLSLQLLLVETFQLLHLFSLLLAALLVLGLRRLRQQLLRRCCNHTPARPRAAAGNTPRLGGPAA
jgi:hypothetical protein